MDIDDLRDQLRNNGPTSIAKMVLTRDVNGVALSLNVSPCSWMYQNYGLQVQINMAGGGCIYILDKELPFEKATEDDLNRMFDQVRIVACKRCGKPAFDPSVHDTNREGLCEGCFMSDLDAELEKATKKEEAQFKRLNAKYKKDGYTHRIDAWIHPKHGGDDYQASFFVKGEPSKSFIEKELAKTSRVTSDYTVVKL